jgi:uncharacterized SAM-binding protein YcdF (DUF218 family)
VEIYLHKLLPFLVLPTGILILLLLIGLVLRRRVVIGAALLLFWLCSTPLFSTYLVRIVEGQAERVVVGEMERADAIVVLSEGRIVAPGVARISEWSDGDRFWGGVDLYQAGKAPILIFTGGWAPWMPEAKPDGEVMLTYAERLGVPRSAIKVTGKVVNTAEEAREVATMLPEGASVLLVTSAFHMPRSSRLFEDKGLKVTPYPVDFLVSAGKIRSVMDFLPSAGAYMKTELAWRELLGRAFYAMKKKIGK